MLGAVITGGQPGMVGAPQGQRANSRFCYPGGPIVLPPTSSSGGIDSSSGGGSGGSVGDGGC